MATPFKNNTILILFLLSFAGIFLEDVHAFPRRSKPAATWGSTAQNSAPPPLPSLQTHAAPLMFSTFTEDDLRQAAVQQELGRIMKSDSLKAHQKSRLRGELYRDFIFSRLHRQQLPGELITIVYIESAFNIRAESRTGARGLWQFADNSMAPLLKASTTTPAWDERFDFWKSTDAATAKLLENYNKTGDWLLAIAAYNGGLGRITRTMASSGNNFWQLRTGGARDEISAETARYIPKFIATSIVSMYPGRFGIMLDWSGNYHWQRTGYTGSLREFAGSTGIPLSTIKAGNAEYIQEVIPPGNHYVKFPARYAATVKENISETWPEHLHYVEAGETLWSISRHYKLTVDELKSMNDIGHNYILRTGTHLIVNAGKP